MIHASFKTFIEKYVSLSDAQFDGFAQSFKLTKFKKGEHFVEEGQVCRNLGFLGKGTLRVYYIDKDGNEITRRLAMEPCMMSAYESLITGKKCRESNQFLDDAEVLIIDRATDLKLMEEHAKYSEFRRVGIEMEFVGVLNYLEQLLEKTVEDRYRHLLQYRPQLLQRVPLQYVSSMLGITPTQLSRIRKKISVQ